MEDVILEGPGDAPELILFIHSWERTLVGQTTCTCVCRGLARSSISSSSSLLITPGHAELVEGLALRVASQSFHTNQVQTDALSRQFFTSVSVLVCSRCTYTPPPPASGAESVPRFFFLQWAIMFITKLACVSA